MLPSCVIVIDCYVCYVLINIKIGDQAIKTTENI